MRGSEPPVSTPLCQSLDAVAARRQAKRRLLRHAALYLYHAARVEDAGEIERFLKIAAEVQDIGE